MAHENRPLDAVDIPSPTRILQVRTGKLAPLGPVQSGIVKDARQGRLHISQSGVHGDEHDLTFHGGPDKVVHQYDSSHYPRWREDYPDHAEKFTPGSFGENFVTTGWSEENMCIGDVIYIEDEKSNTAESCSSSSCPPPIDIRQPFHGCILQVSIPRQPCFKLNQRFGIKNFAPQTHAKSRTGWYYRLLQEGHVEKGMRMRIVQRVNPQWTVARIQHYLYREQENWPVVDVLRSLPGLGKECTGTFEDRWNRREDARKKARITWRTFRLVQTRRETPRVKSFVFDAIDDDTETNPIPPGAHVAVKLPNGFRRTYSVVSGTTTRFRLGVAREENGHGGSIWMHDRLQIGDCVEVGPVTQSLKASHMASKHILIAGGIGITAFVVLLQLMTRINLDAELHYAVRSDDEVAFREILEPLSKHVHIYVASRGQRVDISSLIRNRIWNAHVYVCGPQRMIDAVREAAKTAGMSEDEVHIETFKADVGGDPFTADVAMRGETMRVEVPGDRSLLQTLRHAGLELGSSCEVGSCGTCRVRVKGGRVKHVGTGLTTEEKETEMLSCVSRGVGHIEISIE